MSDPLLTFHPVIPTLLLLAVLAGVTIVLVWAERKRALRYFTFRIVAVVMLMLSLAAILFRPSLRTEVSTSVILLTAGYDSKKVDSLLRLEPGAVMIHTVDTKGYKGSKPLGSAHELSAYQQQIRYVVGKGLSRDALDILHDTRYIFVPSIDPSGISSIRVQNPVVPEKNNIIEGVILNAPANEKLLLSGPGGKVDSVRLTGKPVETFSFTFTPKQSGTFLYMLTGSNGINETLPICMEEQPSSDILFIQHFPTFESRSLKDFLGDHHRILFRYQLSQNRYRYEFINRKPQSIDRLTAEALAAFDLLIIDSDALQALSSTELAQVKRSVSEGLGILTLLNDSPLKIKPVQSFFPGVFASYASDTAQVGIRSKKFTLPAWAFKVNPDADVVTTLKNRNRILSGYRYNGFGKTGFQLLQETYRLMLEGDSLAYSELWAELIGKTARTKSKPFSLRIISEFPYYTDEPLTVEAISAGTAPVVLNDSVPISLTEDLFVDDRWTGKFWPGEPGWHTLTAGDSTRLKYYVSNKKDWTSLAATNAMIQTSEQSVKTLPEKKMTVTFTPIPAWIFYLLFVFSAGFLWLVPKL
ncbi:hypothetical protein KK083_28465 [Fulvivirgaceae bacterium PWU4]|uniref:Uncharacterized protein n=1 Tax=Chryseosolibacter histidini TaxID=2782349 RepID=A0AAP2DUG7_9BACT|nr:hypothetical protein [Chryseosolibacter histidini]MBT1700859.1 hypothetical protein [Chryseosolibacter histidini]